MDYHNEFDPYAAEWLENLIEFGYLPPGHVDRRSIADVKPGDLKGYDHCHFFAGIGGWALALRMAGWADDRPAWTGSCPCQPFSGAGKRKGTADERHLWPEMRRLVAECNPPVVFGEQVASKDGRQWLAGVRADLEALGYAVGAADLCAAGAGAPHIRQRLYWLADAGHKSKGRPTASGQTQGGWSFGDVAGCSPTSGLANADGGLARNEGLQSGGQHGQQPQDGRVVERLADSECRAAERHGHEMAGAPGAHFGREKERKRLWDDAGNGGTTSGLGNTDNQGSQGRGIGGHGAHQRLTRAAGLDGWSTYDIVRCTDGKARRFEPGSFPLAHGVPNRVGRLRGYGNAIVPQVAAEFVSAYMDLA